MSKSRVVNMQTNVICVHHRVTSSASPPGLTYKVTKNIDAEALHGMCSAAI